MRQRRFMQILCVGEAFRLPRDGKPVPYGPEYTQFRVIIHFETAPFCIPQTAKFRFIEQFRNTVVGDGFTVPEILSQQNLIAEGDNSAISFGNPIFALQILRGGRPAPYGRSTIVRQFNSSINRNLTNEGRCCGTGEI